MSFEVLVCLTFCFFLWFVLILKILRCWCRFFQGFQSQLWHNQFQERLRVTGKLESLMHFEKDVGQLRGSKPHFNFLDFTAPLSGHLTHTKKILLNPVTFKHHMKLWITFLSRKSCQKSDFWSSLLCVLKDFKYLLSNTNAKVQCNFDYNI